MNSMRLFGLGLLVLTVMVGCGEKGIKKVTVKGVVTYKGQPLPSGIVQFSGENGFYTAASVQSDGTFIITDVIPGEVKVGVMESPSGSGSSSGDDKSAKPAPRPVDLPQKYRDPNMSGLKYTITEATTELKIAIE